MIDEIADVFKSTITYVEKMIEDLSDHELVQQPTGIPNHGAWTLGHIIYSCQGMAVEIGEDSWLPENWESDFGYGSEPSPDAGYYPNKSEMMSLLSESSQRMRKTLLNAGQSFYNKKLPDEEFSTMGHLVIQVVIAHTAFHAGQLAMWRKAIGKPSVGVFV